LPILGEFTLTDWKELSLNEFVSKFDYSNLNFAVPPVIFLGSLDGSCYATVGEKTNASCAVYLRMLWPVPCNEIKLKYCIFSNDTKKLHVDPSHDYEIAIYDQGLDSYEAVREANSKGAFFVVYEDRVVDAGKFIAHHPGLIPPFSNLEGREISRWFFGSLHAADKKHQHGGDADQLMLKYQVGTIKDPTSLNFHIGVDAGKTIKDYFFKLDKERITDIHDLIKLSSGNVACAPQFNNVSSFGRYYSVYSPYLNMTRNLCCITCAADRIAKEHCKLCVAVDNKASFIAPYHEMELVKVDYIPLIVKAIGKFSAWLGQEAPVGTKFQISGPFVFLTC